jgi:hypothetical protein
MGIRLHRQPREQRHGRGKDGTVVSWSLIGKKIFMAKAFHLFMNMDKMVGGQFEEGLEKMKSIAEAAPNG